MTLAATAAPPAKRMSLANVSKGQLKQPTRTVLYGTEGVGKTSYGADAEAPIFLGPEDGSGHLSVVRFPQPKAWQDVLDAVEELLTADHPYQTLVVDSLDWLEPLVWQHVCAINKVRTIEEVGGGFGKGYTAAVDVWRQFLARLDALRAVKSMQIILIAHSSVKMSKHPDTEDYERYQLSLHQKSAELIKQWADLVMFARHKTVTDKQNNRAKGLDTGHRIVHTERRAAFDAKNRYGLKPELPLDYATVRDALEAGHDIEAQRGRVLALLEEADDAELTGKVTALLKKAGSDGAKIAQLANAVSAKVEELSMKKKGKAE